MFLSPLVRRSQLGVQSRFAWRGLVRSWIDTMFQQWGCLWSWLSRDDLAVQMWGWDSDMETIIWSALGDLLTRDIDDEVLKSISFSIYIRCKSLIQQHFIRRWFILCFGSLSCLPILKIIFILQRIAVQALRYFMEQMIVAILHLRLHLVFFEHMSVIIYQLDGADSLQVSKSLPYHLLILQVAEHLSRWRLLRRAIVVLWLIYVIKVIFCRLFIYFQVISPIECFLSHGRSFKLLFVSLLLSCCLCVFDVGCFHSFCVLYSFKFPCIIWIF